jgi:hypothetical protein
LRILDRLFGSRISGSRSELLHIPENIRSPSAVAVVQGSRPGDIWIALHALRNLGLSYPGIEAYFFVRDEDRDLVQLAGGTPVICPVTAGGRLASGCSAMPPGGLAILASSGADRSAGELLAASGALVRASIHRVAGVNVAVQAPCTSLPESVHFLFERLGLAADRSWRPSPLRDDMYRARSILSPSTGSPPPYIVADKYAARILEKSGAEIPLKVITLGGRGSEFILAGRAVAAATVAGACLVAADSPGLWAEACALHVPAAGLDRRGCFPDWAGSSPGRDEGGFLVSWAEQLRGGLGTETSR